MLLQKTKISKYAVRLSTSRVSPSNSLSDVDWDNGSSLKRKTTSSSLKKKIRYYSIAIVGGLTIAIVILILILVPLTITKPNSTTTTLTVSLSNLIVASIPASNLILSTSSVTATTETSTITQSATISNITATATLFTSTTSTISSLSTSTTTSETITSTTSTSTTTFTSTSSSTTTFAPLQWNATGKTVAGSTSSSSATPKYINFPISIMIDSSDSLYVVDSKNNRVQKFFYGNNTGTTLAGQTNGTVGSNESYLDYPNDVTIDSNGNVYVVDTNNDRVQLWYVNSTSGITVVGNGIAGNTTTQVNSPRGIAYNLNTNTFYVSEANNHRIMAYTLNSTVGTLVAGGNGDGISNIQLSNPRGLYYDSSTNSLVIANVDAHNIVRWVIGASSWTLMAGSINGTSGNNSMSFYCPWDVTLDPMGNMYVADRFNQRVQFFRAGEMNGTTIAGVTNSIGTSSTKFNEPISVALDSQLNLYVADLWNNRIQKFTRY